MIHSTAHPVNKDTEDPVKVGQVLLELEGLRPGLAALPFPPFVGEEDPLIAGGRCTPHHLFVPANQMASGISGQHVCIAHTGDKARIDSPILAPPRRGQNALGDPKFELVERLHGEYVCRSELPEVFSGEHLVGRRPDCAC